MRSRIAIHALPAATVTLLLAMLPISGAAASTTYFLATPPSQFEIGCQGPCACAIVDVPLSGSFVLTPSGTDPLYNYYSLTQIRWTLATGSRPLQVTGTGTYQLGGEFAIMHRLTLDLTVEGRLPQHFDSGLVTGGGEWPAIDIRCAVHGFYCYDTVAAIAAKPATAGVGGGAAVSLRLDDGRPNPFRDRTALPLTIGRSGPVDLRLFDAAGRLVRVLLDQPDLAAGAYLVRWDGLDRGGRPAPAGLYLARLRGPGGAVVWRRIVRVR